MNAIAYDIIVRPIITEKTSRQMELGQYTFEVLPKANKIEIRKAIEEVFKVKVVKVNTIQVRSKPKRMGAPGRRPSSPSQRVRRSLSLRAQAPRQKGETSNGNQEISSHYAQPPSDGDARFFGNH